jgi:hypothetical protein
MASNLRYPHFMNLAALFPNEDYRFAMRFERGRPEDFFAPTESGPRLFADRARWLNEAPAHYVAMLPGGEPLLEETLELLRAWPATRAVASPGGASVLASLGTPESSISLETSEFPPGSLSPSEGERAGVRGRLTIPRAAEVQAGASRSPSLLGQTPLARCIELGRKLEPDFLLLKPDAAGVFRLLAGCVCFPSSWSLEEKMGLPLDEIHGVVPGLNTQLARPISGFLAKMAPGISWLRANWGLSRSAELNNHPSRKLPRLDASVRADEVWLRVEWQSLVALPGNAGVLFGIRIEVFSLAQVKQDAAAAEGLRRALQTMPGEMAAYKGIAPARDRIATFLE